MMSIRILFCIVFLFPVTGFAAQSGQISPSDFVRLAIKADSVQHQRHAHAQVKIMKQACGEGYLTSTDEEGMELFDHAVDELYRGNAFSDLIGKAFQRRLLGALTPPCITTLDRYGRTVAQQILHVADKIKDQGLQAFRDADASRLEAIRKQFRYLSGGHFIEPYVMKSARVNEILQAHIIKKLVSEGAEKVYTVSLLQYLLSSLYDRSSEISEHTLSVLLNFAARHETSAPSIMPMLLNKGISPFISIKRGTSTEIPILATLKRLKVNPECCELSSHLFSMISSIFFEPELSDSVDLMLAGFEVWQDTEQMVEIRRIIAPHAPENVTRAELIVKLYQLSYIKQKYQELKKILGTFGEHFLPEHYRLNWYRWLQISALLGADVPMLRRCVFPFLKKTIKNQDDYVVKKMVSYELDDFHKFAMSCVVKEFLVCLAETLRGRDVYALNAYISGGFVLPSKEDEREANIINAERIRSKISLQAHAYLVDLCTVNVESKS